jgi:hypothetical protein
MDTDCIERRSLLLAPLFAALPLTGGSAPALGAGVDQVGMITRLPEQITWETPNGLPPNSLETAPLYGKTTEPGLYFTLVRWHPGYMSAPRWYATDRLCVVISGTWWVASGEDFVPEATVPMPAGSFVRRVARTPHYDGVKADGKEPAVIAICGIGPIPLMRTDPFQPVWRKV